MQNTLRAALALGAALSFFGITACDRESHTRTTGAAATTPEASTQVIGVKPAEPTGDPAGTTPVDGPQSDLRKQTESEKMPLEGQPNSHSSESPQASQKADDSTKGGPQQ
jgi:hypothetical protein